MKKKNPDATPEPLKAVSDMSLDEINQEIARVELETKKLQLDRARRDNEQFKAGEAARHKANEQRMRELEDGRRGREAIIAACRHKSGGSPLNPLKGGGVGSFSIITRAIMPDGVTVFLQCQRCRMKHYFRPLTPGEELKLQKSDSAAWAEYQRGKKFFDVSIEQGIEHAEIKGPTFFFTNHEGVPVIPERI